MKGKSIYHTNKAGIIEGRLGRPWDELQREHLKLFDKVMASDIPKTDDAQHKLDAGNRFIPSHKDFIDNFYNGTIMAKWIKAHDKELRQYFTDWCLEQAYDALKTAGLLELLPQDLGVN